jgi:hypothetical protein
MARSSSGETAMTKPAGQPARIAKLEKQLADARKEIAKLEERTDDLESDLQDRQELAGRFAALCQGLDDCLLIRGLPLRLRLDIEALAEQLGVSRCW